MNALIRFGAACTALLLVLPSAVLADALRVVATTPDLADLASTIGGDAVEITALAKGPQDVHFVEPRPSFVRALHRADALVRNGMDLEIGWLPALLRSARNPAIGYGGAGSIDASTAIEPLEVPTSRIDRSMGDVHPYGNPHYLTDPLNGLAVAGLLRDRFAALQPEDTATFTANYERFAERLVAALVGESVAASGGTEAAVRRLREGTLGDAADLGGWLGRARGTEAVLAVQDHRYWPYFARRFGIELLETLEPRPGIAPTTGHLRTVVERMRAEEVDVVLTTPYFDPRHARFVSEQTGARVARMAHQVGSVPGADDYVAMIAHNVAEVFGR